MGYSPGVAKSRPQLSGSHTVTCCSIHPPDLLVLFLEVYGF